MELSSDPDSDTFDCVVFVSENLDFTDKQLEFLKAPLNERKEVIFVQMLASLKLRKHC